MSRPKKGDTIVCWFSCGAASAIALQQTIEVYGDACNIRAVNNPIAEEDADNRRFLSDVSRWLDIEIEEATNDKWPTNACVDVWEKRRFMSSPHGAPCTAELKKGARQQWEHKNSFDWMVMGFTLEEVQRAERFRKFERENLLTPLIDAGLDKKGCFLKLLEEGIPLPATYLRGYPNANCIGCVKATSPTYWNHVRKEDPEIFEKRASQSREIGARLVRVKGKRIFLDELSEDVRGRSMRSLDFECGIFCEEKV